LEGLDHQKFFFCYILLAGVIIEEEEPHIVLPDIQWYTSSVSIRILLQFLLFTEWINVYKF
jgi:hypothetical protein